ncbi:MAG: hypothetical protein WC365_09105 [Candidatus Babeliales bacterium]|jgi:hypothetical protein
MENSVANKKVSKESLLIIREILLDLVTKHSNFLDMVMEKHDITDETFETAMDELNEASQ